jgi:hypothetical protein
MQHTIPGPGAIDGTSPPGDCFAYPLEPRLLLAFRLHLLAQLRSAGIDAREFEKGIPESCPHGELEWYLLTLARLGGQ